MGREIKRMPLDFVFPVGESYADAAWEQHRAICPHGDDDDYDHDEKTCGYVYWSKTLPTGEGWQLWQTVSDGPVSPVFRTPEELVDWMSQPVPPDKRPHYAPEAYPERPWSQGWRREVAQKFVDAAARGQGYIPSMIMAGGRILTTEEMIPGSAESESEGQR
jgi:hypothetical protein